ncbi:MAG: hypothetical protein ACYC0F_18295 [Rhodanobacter sp.]
MDHDLLRWDKLRREKTLRNSYEISNEMNTRKLAPFVLGRNNLRIYRQFSGFLRETSKDHGARKIARSVDSLLLTHCRN